MSPRPCSRYLALFAATVVLTLVALRVGIRLPAVHAADEVTWRRQIAPILYHNCTSCHHAGGSGPFPLTSYQDAKRWASVLEPATASRYMPPWLPEPGHGDFAGSRRLPDDDIDAIRFWVQKLSTEGDGKVPEPPT